MHTKAYLLSDSPAFEEIAGVFPFYYDWLPRVIEWMVERFENRPDYPFLDTKYDVINRRDFSSADGLRGPDGIFGWIQGRGLEALAYHAEWLRDSSRVDPEMKSLVDRIECVVSTLYHTLREIRSNNHGHLCFLMDREGNRIEPDMGGRSSTRRPGAARGADREVEDDIYCFADMFCAKGMFAAASLLSDRAGLDEAREYLRAIESSLWDGGFRNGQVTLQENGRVKSEDTRVRAQSNQKQAQGAHLGAHLREQGPYMIFLGALATVVGRPGEEWEEWASESGTRIIDHIMRYHVAHDDVEGSIRKNDLWERVNEDGLPAVEDGKIVSDPGHSLELVGLAATFLQRMRRSGSVVSEYDRGDGGGGSTRRHGAQHRSGRHRGVGIHDRKIRGYEERLPAILFRNFSNGFQDRAGGICKTFDCISRRLINDDMPWWSLPETMRSAVTAYRYTHDERDRARCLEIFSKCHNAFLQHYIRPTQPPLWAQTRDAHGDIVDVIPSCSDVDPGYHTNMSVIEAMRTAEELIADH